MHELIIEPGRVERLYWRDLWRYRELFYFLAWRDILVRYKQTVVGVAWSVIRPFLTMIILTVVFGKLAKMPSGGVPYPILVFCGMLPWQFFATALSESGNSLVGNSNLISKVYFPRLIVPASSVITSLVDFMISAALLVGLMIWYRICQGSRCSCCRCLRAWPLRPLLGPGSGFPPSWFATATSALSCPLWSSSVFTSPRWDSAAVSCLRNGDSSTR